jgi:hypothetical protein
MMAKRIKVKNLLLSGDSWMAGKKWHEEIFDCQYVTNLSVRGSGNKYIAQSVMSSIINNPKVDFVFVNWSGLNRIDIPLPLGVRTEYTDPEAENRTTGTSRYWTNIMAPWRDRQTQIHIEERLVRLMYQEKGYTSVKDQSLLNIINLQDFLKVRQIPYLFCFMYDYANKDFDHSHLTGEARTEQFSTMGSVDSGHPLLAELDRGFCLEPGGMDWALAQEQDYFRDSGHLTDDGYHAWAREMLKYYQTELTGSKGVL